MSTKPQRFFQFSVFSVKLFRSGVGKVPPEAVSTYQQGSWEPGQSPPQTPGSSEPFSRPRPSETHRCTSMKPLNIYANGSFDTETTSENGLASENRQINKLLRYNQKSAQLQKPKLSFPLKPSRKYPTCP